jgi:DNA-binding response OmpR family regulator
MAPRARILLVDDDTPMRETLAEQLSLHEEFEVAEAETGTEAIERIGRENFHMVLLDVGLPDIDGREVCRLIRRKNIQIPVIMLTGRDGDADVILGLDAGANDYVIKPFDLGILIARIRTHLRQHEQSEDARLQIGPYTFRPTAHTLRHNTTRKEIPLSNKESAILKFLYGAGDEVVACETLYSEIWEHNAALTTHTLQTHIYRLRQKIEDNPAKPGIIVSELGGYRIVR